MITRVQNKVLGITPSRLATDTARDREVVDKAVALCKPAAVFERDDVRVIEEAGELIELQGGPANDAERKVLQQAEKLRFYYPTPLPQAATPALDKQIAEAEAVVEVEMAKVAAAKAAWLEAAGQMARKPSNAAQATLREREREWKDMEVYVKRFTVPLARLIAQREYQRRVGA